MPYGRSIALELAAEGKLHNVVVEDDRVGKDLLSKVNLRIDHFFFQRGPTAD